MWTCHQGAREGQTSTGFRKNYQLNCNKTEYRWKSLETSSVGIMILKIQEKLLKACEILKNNIGRSSIHQHWTDARGQTQHWPPADLSVPLFTPSVSNFNFYLFVLGFVCFSLGFVCEEGKLWFVHILHKKPPATNCFVRKPGFKNSASNFFSCITLGAISNKLCHLPQQQSFDCPNLCKQCLYLWTSHFSYLHSPDSFSH